MSDLPDAILRLSDGEKAHPLWRKIVEHLQARLEIERATLEDPKMDQNMTATIRGHIKCLRELIAAQNLPPIQPE